MSRLDGRVPTQTTAETLEIFANMAALAIEDAARYERESRQTRALARRAAELAAILRVGNTLRADLPLDAVLQQIVEGVTQSLGFQAGDSQPGRRGRRRPARGAGGGGRDRAGNLGATPGRPAHVGTDRTLHAAALPDQPVLLYSRTARAIPAIFSIGARPAPTTSAPANGTLKISCWCRCGARRAAARPALAGRPGGWAGARPGRRRDRRDFHQRGRRRH